MGRRSLTKYGVHLSIYCRKIKTNIVISTSKDGFGSLTKYHQEYYYCFSYPEHAEKHVSLATCVVGRGVPLEGAVSKSACFGNTAT